MLVYPYSLPPFAGLTLMQLDGEDCVYCASSTPAPARFVGRMREIRLYAHPECAEEHRIETEEAHTGSRVSRKGVVSTDRSLS